MKLFQCRRVPGVAPRTARTAVVSAAGTDDSQGRELRRLKRRRPGSTSANEPNTVFYTDARGMARDWNIAAYSADQGSRRLRSAIKYLFRG